MNSQTKLWASVSGVCITTAVVIGSVAAASHHTAAPKEAPAGQMVSVAPVQTVTATVTASATPTATPKVSPSTKAPVVKRQAVVQRQEAPVTDQTSSSTAQQQQPVPDPQKINNPGQQLSTGPDGHIVGAPPLPPAPPPPAAPPRMTTPSPAASGSGS